MQQTKEYNVSNCQLEGAQFLHLACQGGRSLPCPPASYVTECGYLIFEISAESTNVFFLCNNSSGRNRECEHIKTTKTSSPANA